MRTQSRDGLNVTELAVVTGVVMLLVLVLIPAVQNAVCNSNMSAVGSRGKDIFVAITGANMEREPLGLPSVWPSENPPITNFNPRDVECFTFSNSTDYFTYLNDGKDMGTVRRVPFVSGFDYFKLAGAGVSACTQGTLTAKNNMWTIAMNVTDDMADIVPILITRNVDASSLAAKVSENDWDKTLRFDLEWETPFGNKGFLLIRKGGSIFGARAKYATYGVVYGKQTFDATVDQAGKPLAKPLTYLTPTRMVVPGERAYAEGAVRVAGLSGGFWRRVKSDFAALTHVARPMGACVGCVYLLVVGVYAATRYRKRQKPVVTGYGLGVVAFHYAAVVLWLGLITDGVIQFRWTLLALALLAQAGGLAFVAARRRDDCAARQRGIEWMIAAPLLVVGGLVLIFVAAPLVWGIFTLSVRG